MQPFLDALATSAGPIALGALVVGILALLIAWRASRRGGAVAVTGPPSIGLVDDPALDRILSAQMQRLDGLTADLQALTSRTRFVEAEGRHAIQSVGLVRFNPFEDTGSNQSFALALLDADDNGVILSSLHSRQATRVYLKAIAGGRCEAALSSEETQALLEAHGGFVASG
jgi:hypothetical protein